MTTVVISQPMLFPWVGMFEQIRLADVYVHYDDVPFSKGSRVNRVQTKTSDGFKWLTIPLSDVHLGQHIRDLVADDVQGWRNRHLTSLEQVYRQAPHKDEMLSVVEKVYQAKESRVVDILTSGIREVCAYFDLLGQRKFVHSSAMGVDGTGSRRVLDLVAAERGDVYVTGHGAKTYLDHELFEENGIRVEYMHYQRTPYPQLYGEFNPHVSILDLIANLGKDGCDLIHSPSVYWRDFLSCSSRWTY